MSSAAVRFAEFSAPDLEIVDAAIVLDGVPTTLTDAGAAAFGTYAAGEELDPISATIPVAADCAAAPLPAPVDDEPISAPVAAEPQETVAEAAPVWPWAVGGGILIVVLVASVWAVAARRRAAQEASATSTE